MGGLLFSFHLSQISRMFFFSNFTSEHLLSIQEDIFGIEQPFNFFRIVT